MSHIKSVHLGIRPRKCDRCDYEARDLFLLRRHVKRAHDRGGEKTLKCPHCEFATHFEENLARHVKAVHLKILDYECPLCDYKSAETVRD